MRPISLLFIAALLVGCSNDAETSSATDATTDTAAAVETTVPAFATSLPVGTIENLFPAESVEEVCRAANDAAYAHAEQLGYWNHPLTAAEQLQYFQIRGGTVDVMIETLRTLGVDTGAAVEALTAYRGWLDEKIAEIDQTGEVVSEDSGGILQQARDALGGSGVCGDLFDMN